ncbi:MAG: ABC transporter ATP-binding protein [Ancrocorticia sp.]|uniref:ABC transporter ATP-binding protein n=1 Tax=Ancrocorticia sp. TaxID=2593684 RepID=UPI003F900401
MLAVEDLAFQYKKGGEELFDGLSYEFSTGCVTAMTGPSGRGKSTLLYILGLMLTPAKGSVLLGDEKVSRISDASRSLIRAQKIGFVFQDSALDPKRKIIDSVIEPALYAGWDRRKARERGYQLLEEMGVSGRADHRPGEISGGQAQRVAVCRALMNDPTVILADEPTGNLDVENSQIVLDTLSAASNDNRRERTVVIATHDPFVISHSQMVLTL